MSSKTTLFLFLLVAVLGGAVWWQTRKEESGAFDLVLPLFEGVDRSRITALRIDHLERGVQVKLERDASRTWYLTDPVEYLAEEAVVRLLLDAVTRNSMVVVSEEERRLAAPGFEPPRALLEVTELLSGGDLRVQTVQIGERDIDGQHVYVRREGELYKTLVNLDTTLTRGEEEYRDRRLLVFDPRMARDLLRSGDMVLEGEGTVDLGLALHRSGIEWRMTRPHQVAADSRVVENFLFALANMRLERFVSEGQHPLERYGLHQPEMRLEVVDREGLSHVVLFGRPGEGAGWFARREGLPQVWSVQEDVVLRATLGFSSMFQLELLQFVRDLVERIELVGGAADLRLDRGEGGWTVSERREGTWGTPLPADRERVEALLADVENARVTRYQLDVDPAQAFTGALRSLAVTVQGQALRARIGGRYRSEEGSEALQAWRDGDRVVALVPIGLDDLFHLTRRDLQTLAVLELDEVRLARLELESAGVTRTFQRSLEGVWKVIDMDAEALELRPVLDHLFFMKAASHLDEPAATLPPLADPVEVRVVARNQDVHAVTVGRGEDGRVYLDHLGTRSVADHPSLHEDLRAIVARKARAAGD